MTTLDELTAREAELYTAVTAATGPMEVRSDLLRAAGILARYGDVLAGYLGLLGDPAEAAEALKRAVFLVWYEIAEPACFTGVGDLPGPLVADALRALNAAAAAGAVDPELAAMLGYYREVAGYAFTRRGPWPALAAALAASDADAWRSAVAGAADPRVRGQLGVYWASVLPVA